MKKIALLLVLFMIPFALGESTKTCVDSDTLQIFTNQTIITDGIPEVVDVNETINCPYGCVDNQCKPTKSGIPINIYILLLVVSFIFFLLSFMKEPRGIFAMISMMLFFFLALTSNSIVEDVCEWHGGIWDCYKSSIQETSLVVLCSGFGLISLIYMTYYILDSFGKGR